MGENDKKRPHFEKNKHTLHKAGYGSDLSLEIVIDDIIILNNI